jgi:hypothetical protein
MESAGCLYVCRSGKVLFVETHNGLQLPHDIRHPYDDQSYVTPLRALYEQSTIDGIFNKTIRIGSRQRGHKGVKCHHGLYVCWSGQQHNDRNDINHKKTALPTQEHPLTNLPSLPADTIEDLAAFHEFIVSSVPLKGWSHKRRVAMREMLRILPTNPFGNNPYKQERVAVCPD